MEGRAAWPDDSPAHTQAEGGPWVWLSEQLYPGLQDCRRSDDPALRCTFRGGEQDVLLQEACFQPFPEDDLVHGDVGQQPVVAYPVVARRDVPFEDPCSRVGNTQHVKATLQSIGTTETLAEAVGILVCQGFLDGVQTKQVESLHASAHHNGDP